MIILSLNSNNPNSKVASLASYRFMIKYVPIISVYVFILKTILPDQKWQFCNYHENAQIEILNLENPLMLIAQIYYLKLNVCELPRPMCFDLSRDARAAIACRVSLACRSRPVCLMRATK